MKKRWAAAILAVTLTLGVCGCEKQPAEIPEPTPAETPVVELTPEYCETEEYSCTVSGEETDYEEIARQLTEQYAKALRARPQNMRQSVRDAQPNPLLEKLVYDAYCGNHDPNFCFIMSLYLDLDEGRVMDWMVGSGVEEPDAGSPYPTYWGWSLEASAEKGEDGNWHLMGTATGGAFARLPVTYGHPGDHPSVEDMLSAWLLTVGETHDWRIFLFLDTEGYGADEVKAEIDQWWSEAEREMILEGIRDYMAEYGDSYTWKTEDWA